LKKRHRDQALNELFGRLESSDFDRRENALFVLAILLRRANHQPGGDDPLSAADLPRELARIRLTRDEQGQIVDRLIQLVVSRRESRASAFWALGEAAPGAGWEPVLQLLKACGDQLEGEAAFQACRALRRWLTSGELGAELVRRGIAAGDPQALLRNWSRASDRRLKRAAQDLTDILNDAAQ